MLPLNLESTVKCHKCLVGKWFFLRNFTQTYSRNMIKIKGKAGKGGHLDVLSSGNGVRQVCLIDWKGCAPGRRTRPSLPDRLERVRPWEEGVPEFAWQIGKGAPLGEGRAHRWMALLGTYWFSIQYPDGVVQIVSTRGAAVSIAGYRLWIRLSRIFFYRQPSRQASTTCPLTCAETAELLDAGFSTARSFHELK